MSTSNLSETALETIVEVVADLIETANGTSGSIRDEYVGRAQLALDAYELISIATSI